MVMRKGFAKRLRVHFGGGSRRWTHPEEGCF
jgi:hypothetical protein